MRADRPELFVEHPRGNDEPAERVTWAMPVVFSLDREPVV